MRTVSKVIFSLPNMTAGGAERVVSILANNLTNSGTKVEIWLYYGSTIHYHLDERVIIRTLSLLNKTQRQRVKILHNRLVLAKKDDANIVFIPFLSAILQLSVIANIGTGIPVIACERNNPYIKGSKWYQRIIAQVPFLMATHCVFQTPDARAYYSLLRDRKCTIIANPIPESSYKWEGTVSASKIVSVCRLHKQKNLIMSLEIIETLRNRFPNIHLDIYGEGDLKDELVCEISKRNLSDYVELKGLTYDVPLILSHSSVYISTSDFEGISNSMLEAMSVGMPIICTDCPIGGARMMLQDDAGILSPVGDVQSFASSLEKILLNPHDAKSLGHKAFLVSLKYTDAKIADIWKSLLNTLLS